MRAWQPHAEHIVRSLVEDYFGQVDALITWARTQPATAAARGEILRRYVGIVAEGDEVFRMLHQNQAAVTSLAAAKNRGELFRERMSSLIELLTGPAGPAELAMFAAAGRFSRYREGFAPLGTPNPSGSWSGALCGGADEREHPVAHGRVERDHR